MLFVRSPPQFWMAGDDYWRRYGWLETIKFMKGEASFSWRIHCLGHPWIGLTWVCGSSWWRNLSVNAICEIPTTILDGRGQLLTKIWLVGNKQNHGRGGIIFMTDPWFRPPIDWTYISLRFRLMAQSFGKCYLWDPHHNFGRQGTIIDEDMVSLKW